MFEEFKTVHTYKFITYTYTCMYTCAIILCATAMTQFAAKTCSSNYTKPSHPKGNFDIRRFSIWLLTSVLFGDSCPSGVKKLRDNGKLCCTFSGMSVFRFSSVREGNGECSLIRITSCVCIFHKILGPCFAGLKRSYELGPSHAFAIIVYACDPSTDFGVKTK